MNWGRMAYDIVGGGCSALVVYWTLRWLVIESWR
jgi:hypothetical protein